MIASLPEPVKSPQDKRLYRRIRLDNQLDVLLIEDPEIQSGHKEDEDVRSMASSAADISQNEVCCPCCTYVFWICCQRKHFCLFSNCSGQVCLA